MAKYQNYFPEVTKKVCISNEPYSNEKIKGLIHSKLKLFASERNRKP